MEQCVRSIGADAGGESTSKSLPTEHNITLVKVSLVTPEGIIFDFRGIIHDSTCVYTNGTNLNLCHHHSYSGGQHAKWMPVTEH